MGQGKLTSILFSDQPKLGPKGPLALVQFRVLGFRKSPSFKDVDAFDQHFVGRKRGNDIAPFTDRRLTRREFEVLRESLPPPCEHANLLSQVGRGQRTVRKKEDPRTSLDGGDQISPRSFVESNCFRQARGEFRVGQEVNRDDLVAERRVAVVLFLLLNNNEHNVRFMKRGRGQESQAGISARHQIGKKVAVPFFNWWGEESVRGQYQNEKRRTREVRDAGAAYSW